MILNNVIKSISKQQAHSEEHTLAVCTHAASDGYKPIYKSCNP